MTPDPRLCLALDVPDAAAAAGWVHRTRHLFATYKIGLQLFCAEGPGIVDAVRRAGAERIFLDLKLHDIPNTVHGAVRSLVALGVDELTLHLGGGPAMLAAAQEGAASSGLALLGVTVLTSLDADALNRTGVAGSVAELVENRARLARTAGIAGLVCSPREVGVLRLIVPESKLVTPGIRLGTDGHGDQKRVSTPESALKAGSDMLVVGRAITAARDLDGALRALARQAALVPRATT